MSADKNDLIKRRWGNEEEDKGSASPKVDEGAKVDELLRRAEPLIEQVNTLYKQFIAGAESLPPNERRKQLDQVMANLSQISKPTAAYKFRTATLNTRYLTYKDRWDRLMKDLEAGRIKRTIGPKR